jgi:hypothetical protein
MEYSHKICPILHKVIYSENYQFLGLEIAYEKTENIAHIKNKMIFSSIRSSNINTVSIDHTILYNEFWYRKFKYINKDIIICVHGYRNDSIFISTTLSKLAIMTKPIDMIINPYITKLCLLHNACNTNYYNILPNLESLYIEILPWCFHVNINEIYITRYNQHRLSVEHIMRINPNIQMIHFHCNGMENTDEERYRTFSDVEVRVTCTANRSIKFVNRNIFKNRFLCNIGLHHNLKSIIYSYFEYEYNETIHEHYILL